MVTESTATIEEQLVGSIPFEQVALKLDPFISNLCKKSNLKIPKEDLKQEALITVWRAHNRYPDRKFSEFIKLSISSVQNRFTDLRRSQYRQKNPPLLFIQDVEGSNNSLENNAVCSGIEMPISEDMSFSVNSDIIARLQRQCSKPTAEVINLVLSQQKKPKQMSRRIHKAIKELKELI